MKKSKKKRILMAAVLFSAGVLLAGAGTGAAIAEYSDFEIEEYDISDNIKTETLTYTMNPEKSGKLILDTKRYVAQLTSLRQDESIPEGEVSFEITYDAELLTTELNFTSADDYVLNEYEFSAEYFYNEGLYNEGFNNEAVYSDNGEYFTADEERLSDNEEELSDNGGEPLGNEENLEIFEKVDPMQIARKAAAEKREKFISEYVGVLSLDFYAEDRELERFEDYKEAFLEGIKNKKLVTYENNYSVIEIIIRVNPETAERIENRI